MGSILSTPDTDDCRLILAGRIERRDQVIRSIKFVRIGSNGQGACTWR